MGKTAHVFSESPPFASLNISGQFGGLPETSAWTIEVFQCTKIQQNPFIATILLKKLEKACGCEKSCLSLQS